MQQIFCDTPVDAAGEYVFSKEQMHHLQDVLHMNHEVIRLVDGNKAYFAQCYRKEGILHAKVLQEDPQTHELPHSISLAMAFIRKEKFELVLQKATELGAVRIVPFVSSHCVVRPRAEKVDKQYDRWRQILKESASQCKRNGIPELMPWLNIDDLGMYQSEQSYFAYEMNNGDHQLLSQLLRRADCTIVIGPEGGFSVEEADGLMNNGFAPVSLGSRILRAETAACYALSVTGECFEKELRK